LVEQLVKPSQPQRVEDDERAVLVKQHGLDGVVAAVDRHDDHQRSLPAGGPAR
jgi:hypothetical protein